MEKFSLDDAMKTVRAGTCYMMHIDWFRPDRTGYLGENLAEKYPDCKYVLLATGIRWRKVESLFGVVIDNGEDDVPMARRYNLL